MAIEVGLVPVRVQGEFADLSGASQSLERIIHDFMFKELKERAA